MWPGLHRMGGQLFLSEFKCRPLIGLVREINFIASEFRLRNGVYEGAEGWALRLESKIQEFHDQFIREFRLPSQIPAPK